MDATTKKLIALLEGGELEMRMAAMRVVTRLGIKDRAVVHALGKALREDSEALKTLALKGLIQLGADDVVEMVIPLILEPGDLREHALQVVIAIGPPAIKPLKDLYSNADFHGKRAIATALSRIGVVKALEFLLEKLLQEPFELQKHFSQCLCEAIDALPGQLQHSVFQQVRKFISLPRVRKDLQAQVVAIILMGHFHHDREVLAARKLLRGYAHAKNPPELRRYALMSLARTIVDVQPDRELVGFLQRCLCDEDWHHIAQQALGAFQRLELPRPMNLRLVHLLKDSPHFSVHIHVLERLSKENSPELAKAILPFLRDSRYRVREAAERALRAMPVAVGDLFAVLADSTDTDLSTRVHGILRDYPQDVKRKFLDRAIQRFMLLYDRNDRRAQFFLEFIRGIDPEPLRRTIYSKVESLKRGRVQDRWIKIARFLQVLWDQHLITPEGRYTFALALIQQSNKDLSPHARRANLGLQVLRALIYDNAPGLVERLTRSKDLGLEELFYIGFHFMEEGGELRPFARGLLEQIVKRSPASKTGQAALQKLTLHGITPGRVPAKAAPAPAAKAAAGKAAPKAAAAPRPAAGGKPPAQKAPAPAAPASKAPPAAGKARAPAVARAAASKERPGARSSSPPASPKTSRDAAAKRDKKPPAGAKKSAKPAKPKSARKPSGSKR